MTNLHLNHKKKDNNLAKELEVNGILGTSVNNTKRKEMELELRKNQEKKFMDNKKVIYNKTRIRQK